MLVYQELRDEVNCRINQDEFMRRIIDQLVRLESVRLNKLVSSGKSPEYQSSYVVHMQNYVNAKLKARSLERNHSYLLYLNYRVRDLDNAYDRMLEYKEAAKNSLDEL